MPKPKTPYSHPADEHFVSLVDYLRHLVDRHGVEESADLWRSGRELFDALHATAHNDGPDHEPDNPQGVWCCDTHRDEFNARQAARNDGTATVTEKDLRHCFERENGYPLGRHSDAGQG